MEWRVVTKKNFTKGIGAIAVVPALGQTPTYDEWVAIRNVVEQAVKKASGQS